ncbi:Outer membrane protein TolC [Marinobacter sp. DSM 26671]|jgi:outer membrane protein TolC|uniref:TolC family protein n=1 Tax=Marinobacter sp. DSM 26671 TaxID=1761793 RepID=UPI0008EBBD65|nr:TolC family protein [Marinobacter sp. DSM 26671]SFD95589.1 Outer membrane protein TolC [Marinobacter sp. DSM 26671]
MKKVPMSRVLLVTATAGFGLGVPGVWASESTVAPFANDEVALDQRRLITSMISRNGQALFARLQRQVASGEVDQQRSLLQAELFADGRYTDTEVQNSASDKLSSFERRNQDVFKEQSADVEAGVRVPVMTGAELVLSWSGTQRENNLIPLLSQSDEDNEEFVASLNLSIRQPLLQGFGNRVAESRIREAELRQQVVEREFHEQLLRASSEALRAYWRLHLATRFIEIQQSALANARNIMEETSEQVRAGRQPRTALLEAEARVLDSEAAVHAEEQRWRDAQSELKTLLSLSDDEYDRLTFVATDRPETDPFPMPLNFQRYADEVLTQWPGYQGAVLKRDIQALEVRRAGEENRNQLDLVTGYRTSAVGDRVSDTLDQSYQNDYPTWYVGLEFSMPLGTNLKRRGSLTSAEARKRQADIELRDVRVSVVNELRNRLTQLEISHGDLTLAARNQEIYGELYESERQRYAAGKSRLRDLYEREDERIEAQKRYAESLARYQLALVAMQLAEGSLFERYGIRIGETGVGSSDKG